MMAAAIALCPGVPPDISKTPSSSCHSCFASLDFSRVRKSAYGSTGARATIPMEKSHQLVGASGQAVQVWPPNEDLIEFVDVDDLTLVLRAA